MMDTGSLPSESVVAPFTNVLFASPPLTRDTTSKPRRLAKGLSEEGKATRLGREVVGQGLVPGPGPL